MRNVLILVALIVTVSAAPAGDYDIGEVLSAACAACHGAHGAEPTDGSPVLAGQHEKYLVRAMLAYQNGAREVPLMAGQMTGLSRRDIDNLAAYFAAQPSPLR